MARLSVRYPANLLDELAGLCTRASSRNFSTGISSSYFCSQSVSSISQFLLFISRKVCYCLCLPQTGLPVVVVVTLLHQPTTSFETNCPDTTILRNREQRTHLSGSESHSRSTQAGHLSHLQRNLSSQRLKVVSSQPAIQYLRQSCFWKRTKDCEDGNRQENSSLFPRNVPLLYRVE